MNNSIILAQPPFFAPQGEADYAGMPSVWLRLFGCNLQCGGFGQDSPTDPSTYVFPQFDAEFNSLEEMPVFERGCDSGYAWNAKFKKFSKKYSYEELADEVLSIINYKWYSGRTSQPVQLCFTGGEPMLQQRKLVDLVKVLEERGCAQIPQITIETNGTQALEAKNFSIENFNNTQLHFAISPKLWSVSGEKNKFYPNIISEYLHFASSSCIKIVHNGSAVAWRELGALEPFLQECVERYGTRLYIMPCGGTVEAQSSIKIAQIADEAIKRGYFVASRNHVYLYGNSFDR